MGPERTGKKKNKLLSRLAYFLFLLVILFIAGEITVRVMGAGPWQQAEQSFEVKPGKGIFKPDPVLGYRGKPGSFDIILDKELSFHLEHNEMGFRDGPINTGFAARPEIWILGCSFTHGFGVSEGEPYPAVLQKLIPKFKIRNFGMSGYSTLQSKLLLEQLLETRIPPFAVIYAYGSFHDQRNTNNRFWRKALSGREVVDGLTYPQVRYEGDSLRLAYSDLEYSGFPGMGWSALINYFETTYNHYQNQSLKSYEITAQLIRDISEMCARHKTSFCLAGIYRHESTVNMLEKMEKEGIMVADIGQDHEDPSLRILPHDAHPNALAHRNIAHELYKILEQNILNFETPQPQ